MKKILFLFQCILLILIQPSIFGKEASQRVSKTTNEESYYSNKEENNRSDLDEAKAQFLERLESLSGIAGDCFLRKKIKTVKDSSSRQDLKIEEVALDNLLLSYQDTKDSFNKIIESWKEEDNSLDATTENDIETLRTRALKDIQEVKLAFIQQREIYSLFNTISQKLAIDLLPILDSYQNSDLSNNDLESLNRIMEDKLENALSNDPDFFVVKFLNTQSRLEESILNTASNIFFKNPHFSKEPIISDDFPLLTPEKKLQENLFYILLDAWDQTLYSPKNQNPPRSTPLGFMGYDYSPIINYHFPSPWNCTGSCFMINSIHYLKRTIGNIDPDSYTNYPYFRKFLQQDDYSVQDSPMLEYELGTILVNSNKYKELIEQRGIRGTKYPMSYLGSPGNEGRQFTFSFLTTIGLCGGYDDAASTVLKQKLNIPSFTYRDQSNRIHTAQMIDLEPQPFTKPHYRWLLPRLQTALNQKLKNKKIDNPPKFITLQFYPLQRTKNYINKKTLIRDAWPIYTHLLNRMTLQDSHHKRYYYTPCYISFEIAPEGFGHSFGVSYENNSCYEYNNHWRWKISKTKQKKLESFSEEHASFIAYERIDSRDTTSPYKNHAKISAPLPSSSSLSYYTFTYNPGIQGTK